MTQTITILNGSKYDQEILAEIIFEILTDVYAKSPWSLPQIQVDLRREDVTYLVAVQEGEVLGFLTWQDLFGEIEVTNLAVKTTYGGQGIGSRLLAHLPKEMGSIFLEVRQSNTVAQHLYKKFGFVELGVRKNYYHQPREDAVIMKR
ncbi:ribosomal protein S18-alanine N-acetyltransferase [Streptococcus sp. sy004]|uniref:ribosomal protein S18-alanine N-acetyltransferase n=1 Tax=Streptococcus sp. sy004 TaxID=2600149 RepID=UPI0011B389F7|nr:ribosomal protein S18-alanine N-acetyltransferase [Streptococcus sp. sy004]TWT11200.1 ribosomal-protein-alanine N-acetyltransferase [Streptococcus sp. sy004]